MKKLKSVNVALVAFVAFGLGACSARDCGGDAPYMKFQQAGTLIVPDGVNLPPGSGAYAIPNGGNGELIQSREYTDEKGNTRTACLYEPPRFQIEEQADDADATKE